MRRHFLLGAAIIMATTGCSIVGGNGSAGNAQEQQEEGGRLAITHYSDATEMFVEFPALVVGQSSRFAAHLSWIADYRGVGEGQLTVELVRPDGSVQRVASPVSDTPGIFRPEMTPTSAGPARLVMRLQARGRTSVHDLGQVQVYASQAEALRAHPAEDDPPGRIGFTKEIQWRIPFNTAVAGTMPLEATVPVTVDVRLAPDAEAIIAAPVAGILRLNGTVPAAGMEVRAGQVLGTISAQLGAGEDVASLDLEVTQARINVQAAQREVGRLAGLVRAEAVPQRRLNEAQTALRLAQAQLGAASRRRQSLAGGGAGVPLVAPISGRILSATLVRGGAVAAGDQLVRIGNPDSLWLVAHVPEAQVGLVGSPGGLDLTRNGEMQSLQAGRDVGLVQGRGVIDSQTRMMDVVFASRGLGLAPGQRLQGRLRTGAARNVLAIPASAVSNENGQNVVYVQVEGEAFERRVVQIGLRSGAMVEVSGDVRSGERVVTIGAESVRAAAASPASFGEGHAH